MDNQQTEIKAEEIKTAEPVLLDKSTQQKKDNVKEWVKDLGIAIIIVALFMQFFMPTMVRQHSMENTLESGDYVFVSKRIYTWFNVSIKRGDIIVFQSKLSDGNGGEKLLVKRVIGVPGDKVEIKDGCVYINGEAIQEDYTKDGVTNGAMQEVTVPEGSVFVLGDNRQNSTDSRSSSVGFVEMDSIKGKVFFRLFPLKNAGAVK